MSDRVLVIYTGGTIGSTPRDPGDPESPQFVVPWEQLERATPEISRLGFDVHCVSTPTPLDSCNVGPAEWRFMAETIERTYDAYAGWVILHGTDTMVYTASALSFMLRNLSKPVVITGAQRSAMVSVRNDATQNIVSALAIANPVASRIPLIPEVVIVFGGMILRGNRTIKRDTVGYQAYESPNVSPLGEIGDQISVNTRLVLPVPLKRFSTRLKLDEGVLPLLVYPGVQNTDVVARQLNDPDVKAVVVLAFGSGNIPTKAEFLDEFRSAKARHMVLANVSQCVRGPVELGIYETSEALLAVGFVSGHDITLEAAQCKLMVALGDPEINDPESPPEERQRNVERYFETAQAGEQTVSIYLTEFGVRSGGSIGSAESCSARYRIRPMAIEGRFTPGALTRAILRLRGARLVSTDGNAVECRVFVNLDPDGPSIASDPGYAGSFRKYVHPGDRGHEGVVMFDITRTIRAVVEPGSRVSMTVLIDSAGSLSWETAELALFINEIGNS